MLDEYLLVAAAAGVARFHAGFQAAPEAPGVIGERRLLVGKRPFPLGCCDGHLFLLILGMIARPTLGGGAAGSDMRAAFPDSRPPVSSGRPFCAFFPGGAGFFYIGGKYNNLRQFLHISYIIKVRPPKAERKRLTAREGP